MQLLQQNLHLLLLRNEAACNITSGQVPRSSDASRYSRSSDKWSEVDRARTSLSHHYHRSLSGVVRVWGVWIPFLKLSAVPIESILESIKMYCLQWLIPVLLIPKPVNPALLYNHAVLMVLYLTGFFLERKPCTICSIVFAVALALVWFVHITPCHLQSLCNFVM